MDLHWENATPQRDELWIPLTTQPDQVWAETFDRIAAEWQSETRGQQWDGVQLSVDGKAVVFFGMDSEVATGEIKHYVAQLLRVVEEEVPRERQHLERGAAEAARAAKAHSDTSRRLADELRGDD